MSPQTQTNSEPEAPASSYPPMPASAQVIQMAGGLVMSRALYVLAELGIADHLEAGALSANDLAQATATHGPSMHRLLRMMAGFGFFAEDEQRRFTLMPLGAALQSDAPGQARATVQMLAGPTAWKAWGEFLHSVKTGETAMEKAYGQTLFDFLSENRDQSELFNQAMLGFTAEEKPAMALAYDFSGVKKLVDVGGGNGHLLFAILNMNPHLKGVLYELPHPAWEAHVQLESSEGLAERCEIVQGDFFQSVPRGGDCYILSHVLHDWHDEKSLQILENCRAAMETGATLLLVETVMPEGNDFHLAKFMDVNMLAFTGGMERTVEEYDALLSQVGFELVQVKSTPSLDSVIEARLL